MNTEFIPVKHIPLKFSDKFVYVFAAAWQAVAVILINRLAATGGAAAVTYCTLVLIAQLIITFEAHYGSRARRFARRIISDFKGRTFRDLCTVACRFAVTVNAAAICCIILNEIVLQQ